MMDQVRIEAQLNALTSKIKPQRPQQPRYRLYGAIAAAILAVPLAYVVDTKVFPVIKGVNMVIQSPAPEGQTRVSFIFDKARDCQASPLEVYLKKNGDLLQPVEIINAGRMRRVPVGRYQTSVFLLNVPEADFIEHGLVILHHHCHPLWTHVTRWLN
jgi:hypothetical protein